MLSFNDVWAIVENIKYKDWTLRLTKIDDKMSTIHWFFVEDGELQICRKWVIDHTQPHSDIVRTALAAAIMAEEHEVREKFRYRGKRVFNPHYDVDRLAEISGKLENLDIPISPV